jgi:5-formyltetrahydrofolate cyclo-ligase
VTPLREEKVALRAEMKRLRGLLDERAVAAAGAAVTARVLALPELAPPFLCYLSVRREVPTRDLVEALRRRGAVAVPRVIDGERMEARLLVEPLVIGVLGIPTSDGPVVDDVAVALCPGLAFDRTGARLGYGAGYYDRWLAAHPAVIPIGLTFDESLIEAVPSGSTDRRMALVVTPGGIVRPSTTAGATR